MRRMILSLVMTIFALPANLSGQAILANTNEFNGISSWQTEGNHRQLEREEGHRRSRLFFELAKQVAEGDTTYGVAVTYLAPDWMFIVEDYPLIILLDGERVVLENAYTSRDNGRGGVSEFAVFDATPEQLHRIATATEVRFQLSGSEHNETWRVKDNARTNYA